MSRIMLISTAHRVNEGLQLDSAGCRIADFTMGCTQPASPYAVCRSQVAQSGCDWASVREDNLDQRAFFRCTGNAQPCPVCLRQRFGEL